MVKYPIKDPETDQRKGDHMKRTTTLWRIPAFGIVAGVIWFFLNSHFLGSLSLVTLPDNTVTVDPLRSLLMDLLVLVTTMAYCALWVTPKMTRKEVFRSSLVLVAFMLGSVAIQGILSATGSGAAQMAAFYLAEPFEWCNFIFRIVHLFTGNLWISMVVQSFSPLIFVIFGKKELPDYTGIET